MRTTLDTHSEEAGVFALSGGQSAAEDASVLILELARCETIRAESRRGSILWGVLCVFVVLVSPVVRPMLLVLVIATAFSKFAYDLARYRRSVRDVTTYGAALRQEFPSGLVSGAGVPTSPAASMSSADGPSWQSGSIDGLGVEAASVGNVASIGVPGAGVPSSAYSSLGEASPEPELLSIPELQKQMAIGRWLGPVVILVPAGLCLLLWLAQYRLSDTAAAVVAVAIICLIVFFALGSYRKY
jgi:hypothetical protein